MILPTPTSYVAPGAPPIPEDSGDFARLDKSGAQGLFAVEDVQPGVVRNGNHFFFSAFYRAEGLDTYPLFDIGNEGGAFYILNDADLQLRIKFQVDGNGRLSELDDDNCRIELYPVTAGDPPDDPKIYNLCIAPSGDRERRININIKEWLWLAFYIDGNDSSNSKFYLNGVELTNIQLQTPFGGDGENNTIFRAYGISAVDPANPTVEIGHQWFGTAADGSVIGQRAFLNEFVETDGTAKNLGDTKGTVAGITPHYYFGCNINPLVNEVDETAWAVDDNTGTGFDISAVEGDVDWYAQPEAVAVGLEFTGSSPPAPYHRLFERSTGTNNDRVFYSVFVLGGTWRRAFMRLYGQGTAQYMEIDLQTEYTSGSTAAFGSHYTGSNRQLFRFIPTVSTVSGQWFHVCGYFDTAALASSWLRFNGRTTTTNHSTSSSSRSTRPALKELVEVTTSEGDPPVTFAHFVAYEQDVVDAATGVDWTDETLWENFVNPDGTPKDLGIYGENAVPGVLPSLYVNPSLRLGLNGVARAGTLITSMDKQAEDDAGTTALWENRPIDANITVNLP